MVIAAITSCTNTSNPSVLIGAGLLAKNAVEKGLKVNPYVKTSLAPGSRVVEQYLKTGKLNSDQYKGHNLLTKSSKYMYDHKVKVDEIVETVFVSLNQNQQNLPLQKLQKNLLFNSKSQYPIEIDLPIDIFNYKHNSTKVLIKSQIKDDKSYDFYSLRRQNLIRNKIELVQ